MRDVALSNPGEAPCAGYADPQRRWDLETENEEKGVVMPVEWEQKEL